MKKQKPKKPRTKAEIAREYAQVYFDDVLTVAGGPMEILRRSILAALKAYDREIRRRK